MEEKEAEEKWRYGKVMSAKLRKHKEKGKQRNKLDFQCKIALKNRECAEKNLCHTGDPKAQLTQGS